MTYTSMCVCINHRARLAHTNLALTGWLCYPKRTLCCPCVFSVLSFPLLLFFPTHCLVRHSSRNATLQSSVTIDYTYVNSRLRENPVVREENGDLRSATKIDLMAVVRWLWSNSWWLTGPPNYSSSSRYSILWSALK
jgi:hypothetical protein